MNHVFVRLASILLMLAPLPKLLADLREFDLLPEKIAITVPFFLGEIAHLLHFRVAELALARCNCVRRNFSPKYGQGFASQPLLLMCSSKKVSLLMEQSASSRFA